MSYELVNHSVACPYCGERIDIVVDPSVEEQSYIEDCSVCCQPMQLNTTFEGSNVRVDVQTSD